MGEWRVDQSKTVRRYIWGQTRGQKDSTWGDFARRAKKYPAYADLRMEKIGSEIHLWRSVTDTQGRSYWTSCLRFIDEGLGRWSVMYRPDERRWRATPIKETPLEQALSEGASFYQGHASFVDTSDID